MANFQYECPIDEKTCSLVILSTCPPVWTSGAHLVGSAMSVLHDRMKMIVGDLVIEERLRNLIDLGFIECDDRSKAYGQYRVKKAELI